MSAALPAAAMSAALPAAAAPPLKTYGGLYEAMCGFVVNNLAFESTQLNAMVAKDMGEEADLTKAALVPIRHRALGFDDALKFGFAVMLISGNERESDPAVPAFDLVAYNEQVSKVYDISVEALVWGLLESDDEEEDSDEDDDEEPDLPEGGGAEID